MISRVIPQIASPAGHHNCGFDSAFSAMPLSAIRESNNYPFTVDLCPLSMEKTTVNNSLHTRKPICVPNGYFECSYRLSARSGPTTA